MQAARETFAAAPPVARPAVVNWRSHQGCDWITAVRDQKNCGACVSFATCAVLEARLRIAKDNCNLNVDLSEADLFYCGCNGCCAPGWNFVSALNRCQSNGVGRESDFPYTPGNQPCQNITPIVRTTGYSPLATMDDRRNAIFTNGPVIAGIRVFEDFYFYKQGVYRHAGGIFKGLHAVAVVGYDDDRDCWIVKNSWGTGWGNGGFCDIGYGEVGIDSLFPFYDPQVIDINTTPIYS
ncbi:MAG TPA: C1 family peptidase [Bryobacteraceae bacterium]|nr:C1 family peptidase [Bryobacteraceae bacterium]